MIVTQRLHKIPSDKFHVIEFCKIKNMRFRQHGRGNIQLVADLREVIEKMRIGQFFGIFIYVLFADSSVRHQFSPNSHIRIIPRNDAKSKLFERKNTRFPFCDYGYIPHFSRIR